MGAGVNSLIYDINSATGAWFDALAGAATNLLLTLAVISLVVKVGLSVLRGGMDLGELTMELVKRVLWVGFFLAALEFIPSWSHALLEGFKAAASLATGSSATVDAGSILSRGVRLAEGIIDASSWSMLPVTSLAALVICMLYSAICGLVLVTYAEFYIAAAAGSLFLGFGGAEWTSDIARRYLVTLVAIAVRLYALYLILGFGEQLTADALGEARGEIDEMTEVLSILAIVFVLFLCAMMIPASMQGIIGGSVASSMSPLALMQGSMAAVGSLAGGAMRGGAAVQQAGALAAAQTGASGLREAARMAGGGSAIRGAPGIARAAAGNLARGLIGAAAERPGGAAARMAAQRHGVLADRAAAASAPKEPPAAGGGVTGSIGPSE